MSDTTTLSALHQCLPGAGGSQGARSLLDWIILSCKEAWPSVRISWACGTLKLGIRQDIYVPVFEDPDQATVTVRIKDKILQTTRSTWYGTQISMLSSATGQDIYNIGLSIADPEETDKYQQ